MNKIKLGIAGVGIVFGLVVPRLAAWNGDRMAAQARAEAARANRGAGPSNETQNEQLGRKLSAYAVPCANQLGDAIANAANGYYRWARGETLSKETTRPGSVLRIHAISPCQRAAANAVRLEPRLHDVEATVAAYIEAAKAFDAVLARADEYYREHNYEDDQFALGNELHREIAAKLTAVRSARDTFRALTDTYNDRMTEVRLAELQRAPGRRLEFLITRISRDAEKLVDVLGDAGIDETGKLVGVDPAAFTQKSVAFEAAVDELRAYYDQHPAERRSVENANGYINALAHYLVPEIKAISRRLESATVYTENELANNPLGDGNVAASPGRAVRQYNATVDAYNRMRFEVVTTDETER